MLLLAGLWACTPAGEGETGAGAEVLPTCDELAAAAPQPSGTATALAVDNLTDPSHLCDEGAPLALTGDLRVMEADWKDLSPLACVESISGALYLYKMFFLESLAGADHLGSIGSLRLDTLPQIDSLEPLAGVMRTGTEAVSITQLPRLPDFTGLRCTEAVDFGFALLPAIHSFAGVPMQSALPSLSAELLSVTSLDTLAGMTVGTLRLTGLPYLEEATLAEVTVTDHLTVEYSERLASLALPSGADDGYHLTVEGNPALVEITAPPAATLLRTVQLVDLPALTEVEALSDQETIPALNVTGTGLSTPGGFPGLMAVDNDLEIRDNPGLTSLTGLASLRSVGSILTITGNTALPEAEAEAFAAGLDVGFKTDVSDNGP